MKIQRVRQLVLFVAMLVSMTKVVHSATPSHCTALVDGKMLLQRLLLVSRTKKDVGFATGLD